MRTMLGMGLLLSFAGCGPSAPKVVDEETFALSYAETYCHRLEECLEGLFYSEFLDQEDCVRDVSGDQEDANDFFDDRDCDFEVDEAQECATAHHVATCEQFYEYYFEERESIFEPCYDIYDC